MTKELPKISIITPSFNQGQYLEQTIRSVLEQGYPNLEYIIIDGGSRDQSVEIIRKYASQLTYWVSEKDTGQADAINKGLKYCTGDIFNWINSDDYLAAGALDSVAASFAANDAGTIAGAVMNIREDGGSELIVNAKLTIAELLETYPSYVYHQPGVWLRMDIMRKTGMFKTGYHYCFDQEYMLRYLVINNKVAYIPHTLAFFRLHSGSKTVAQAKGFLSDFNRMYKEFYQANVNGQWKKKAKRKSEQYNWQLILNELVDNQPGRYRRFTKAFIAMMKNPAYRLNRNTIGRLKHILFGPNA